MSNLISNINNNLPQKLRDEHTTKVGDIYIQPLDYSIVRIESKINERIWHVKAYNFEDKDFTADYHNLSDGDIKSYFTLILHPLDVILKKAHETMEGECSEDIELSDDTALIRSGKDNLLELQDRISMEIDMINTVIMVTKAKADEVKKRIEKKAEKLNKIMMPLKEKIDTIKKVLSWLHAYLGEDIEIQTIMNGQGADSSEPLTIRQRILYMDEEVAIIDDEGQGLDHTGKDVFYEWIKNPRNRDIVLPEPRCAVVMKPKRFSHHYTTDYYINSLLDKHNHHSFIMIRDGENIHSIESSNLCIYGTAIPSKKQYQKIENSQISEDTKERHRKELQSRAMFYMMLLQGLADNSDILGVHAQINISKQVGVNIVLDAEEDTMIGTGIIPFKQWLNEKQKNIKRGDRVIFYREYSSKGGNFLRYYRDEFSCPNPPNSGLYSVDVTEYGQFFFKYLPYDNVFNQTEGRYADRKKRESFIFYRENVINFDTTTLEELETYLNDRTQRENYAKILNVLLTMRKYKKEEIEAERHFVNLMVNDIISENPRVPSNDVREKIEDAVKWWKLKVIFKRPLSADDAKAYRMIRAKVCRNI